MPESGTSNHPGPYTVVFDGREACGFEMLKRRVGFLLCLWKRDPALNSEETLAALARAQRAALGVRNAAPGGHEIHRPGGDLQRIALAVAVHDTAVEKIGDGRKPDVGMRANVHASAGDELHWSDLIEEDEHQPSGVWRAAARGARKNRRPDHARAEQ